MFRCTFIAMLLLVITQVNNGSTATSKDHPFKSNNNNCRGQDVRNECCQIRRIRTPRGSAGHIVMGTLPGTTNPSPTYSFWTTLITAVYGLCPVAAVCGVVSQETSFVIVVFV